EMVGKVLDADPFDPELLVGCSRQIAVGEAGIAEGLHSIMKVVEIGDDMRILKYELHDLVIFRRLDVVARRGGGMEQGIEQSNLREAAFGRDDGAFDGFPAVMLDCFPFPTAVG